MVEVLCLAEVGEVLVVGKDLNWERGSSQIMVPSFQGVDNSKEFSIIDIVISFGWEKGV